VGVLEASFASGLDTPDNVGSSVLDITITDPFGILITSLPDELEICITTGNRDPDDYECLGFFNEQERRWECEDRCLEERRQFLCGTTDHLTSFALLLGGNNNENECGSSGDFVIAWISLAAVVLALLFMLLGILAIEIHIRYKQYKSNHEMEEMTNRITKAQSMT